MTAPELIIAVDFQSLLPENWVQDHTLDLREQDQLGLELNPLPEGCHIEGDQIPDGIRAFLTRRYGDDIGLNNVSRLPDKPTSAFIHVTSRVQEGDKPVDRAFASLEIDLTDPARPQYSMSESPIARGRWMTQKSALLAQTPKAA